MLGLLLLSWLRSSQNWQQMRLESEVRTNQGIVGPLGVMWAHNLTFEKTKINRTWYILISSYVSVILSPNSTQPHILDEMILSFWRVQFTFKYLFCYALVLTTDNERVMAISQILYGQYHIWELYVLGLKSKVFFCKTTTTYLKPWTSYSQGQDGYCSLAENAENAPTGAPR